MEAAASLSQLSPVDAGRSYALLAEAFEELGDEERAAELYELALERLEATPNRYAVETFSRFAALLERRGRKDEAYELLKRAMNVQQQADRALAPRRDASDS
jgi:tetratricopeptide (TPR) repeat protein